MLTCLVSVGYVLQPEEVKEPKSEPVTPTVSMGCQYLKFSGQSKDFASGYFDELAIWKRYLNDTDKALFLGGYSKEFLYSSIQEQKVKAINHNFLIICLCRIIYGGD